MLQVEVMTVPVNSSPGADSAVLGSVRLEMVVPLREKMWRETSGDPGTNLGQILTFRGWEERVRPSTDPDERLERWKGISRRTC